MQQDFHGTRKAEAQGEKYVGGSDCTGGECRASNGDAKIYADEGHGPAQRERGRSGVAMGPIKGKGCAPLARMQTAVLQWLMATEKLPMCDWQ